MKSRKVVQLENELKDDEYFESINEINKGLALIDKTIETDTPSLEWFEQMVNDQNQAMKKKFQKEMIAFILIAILVLSGVLFSLYRLPYIFLILQLVATIFIAGYGVSRLVGQVKET